VHEHPGRVGVRKRVGVVHLDDANSIPWCERELIPGGEGDLNDDGADVRVRADREADLVRQPDARGILGPAEEEGLAGETVAGPGGHGELPVSLSRAMQAVWRYLAIFGSAIQAVWRY
jgi:hypothetical protein